MYGTVPVAPHSNGKTFFGLHRHLAVALGALGNNMVSRLNHILYHFSIETIHLHLASFTKQNTLKNKLA